jgi:selenium donor protein
MPNHKTVKIGFETSDDSAVVDLKDGTTIIQTVDFFTPVVDDPYYFGQIAAANALSDIYAMGGDPLFALNIVGFPINDLPKSILTKILQGGIDKAAEAGIPIVGGHSVDDKEPKYGMAVTGEIDKQKIWKNSEASSGDLIILTKALGTGIIASGIKKELVSKKNIEIAIASMSKLNKNAANILKQFNPSAVTDISGFGLLGHLKEVCENSNVTAEVEFSKLKFLPGVYSLANSGIIPGGTQRNYDYVKEFCEFNPTLSPLDHLLASDAQTSGGLLIALNEAETKKFLHAYREDSSIIGVMKPRSKKLINIV